MSDIRVPPNLESHSFTEVAAAGGDEDWLSIDGVTVDEGVNGFIFDEKDQKVRLGSSNSIKSRSRAD